VPGDAASTGAWCKDAVALPGRRRPPRPSHPGPGSAVGAGGRALNPRLFSRLGVHLRRAEGAAERPGHSGFVEQPADSHRHGLSGDDAGELGLGACRER